MKLGTGVVLLAAVIVSPEVRYFQYERPLLNTSQRATQTCLVLDAGIFAHAAPHLADLRLYRDSVETPYVIRIAGPVEVKQRVMLPLNLGLHGQQTLFDAVMAEEIYSDLDLDVAAQNFIATVTVYGSHLQSGSSATKLGSYTIFDLSREKLGRSTVLHLPESNFRYLHFKVAGPLRPESITSLALVRMPESQLKYETVAESSHVTQKGHSSVLEFDVPAHVPVDRAAFAPDAEPASFSRDVRITVTPVLQQSAVEDVEIPQPVNSSGTLLRVHSAQNGHRIDEEHLAIDAPEENFDTPTKWTITIDNGDDAPLTIQSVRLQMLQRNLCFKAADKGRYALFYGDPLLPMPQYDYATLFTPQADAAQTATGPETRNPDYRSRPDERPFTEKHPAVLWAALLFVMALLGGIALRSANRVEQRP